MVTFTTGIILTSNLKLTSPTRSLEETIEILVILIGRHYNFFHITFTTSILMTSYFNLTYLTCRPLQTIEELVVLLRRPYNHLNNSVLLVIDHST
jgi:hypothetical protein